MDSRFVCTRFRSFVWVVTTVLSLLLIPKLSPAQISGSSGTILGTVKDQTGAVVPQAKVTVVNTDTNATRIATTGDDGSFRFPALLAGHYSVKVEKGGFKTEIQTGLTLEVAQEMVVNSQLEIGAATQEVSVTGETSLVDTTNSSLGGTVNEVKMADLPLNGRNYTDLTLIQPGIAMNPNLNGSNQTGGTRGTFFASDGVPIRSNLFTLDGANLMNGHGGSSASESGTSLGVGGIQEFKVVTGAYDASYGNVPGAQVVMVSKGGSNEYHGELYEYLRNNVLDAANYFDVPVAVNNYQRLPPFKRNNFGADAGGPIRRDKTFVYGAYEELVQRFGLTTVDTVPGSGCHGAANAVITSTACPQLGSGAPSVTIAPVMAPILALYPTPNLPNNQYTYPYTSPTTVGWGQIRVDQNISASDTLFGRFTMDKSDEDTAQFSGNATAAGTGFPEFTDGLTSSDQFATISENHIFTPSLLNQFRFSYSRSTYHELILFPDSAYSPNGESSLTSPQLSFVTGQPIGVVTLNGYTGFGGNAALYHYPFLNTYTLTDDLYFTKGKHSLRFGTEVNKYNIGGANASNLAGGITFTNLSNFLQGIASTYIGEQGGASAITSMNWMYWVPALYAQDDWRAFSRLTFNLGLRYEFLTMPHEKNERALVNDATDATFTYGQPFASGSMNAKDHFQPRVGFAWDVQGNGKTSVRGGVGEYYELGELVALLFTDSQNQPPLDGTLAHVGTTHITLPLTYAPTDQLAYATVDYHTRNPYMFKWNLSVERQLPWRSALQATYVGSRGNHLYQLTDSDPILPSALVNGLPYWNNNSPRENPNFSYGQTTDSEGWSTYHGLQVALNKQVSHGIEFQVAYTYSHALDNALASGGLSDCTGAPGMNWDVYYGPGAKPIQKGPGCSDMRHNVHINVLYHIPNIASNNFAAKLEHGWWLGTIWSANTGYPFSPILGTNRSQSGILPAGGRIMDRPNIATTADAAACPAVSPTCKYVPVPYNAKTVIKGTAKQWFNPNMFTLEPMFESPGGPICTSATCGVGTTYGTLGDAQRGLLRGPGLDEVDVSINKDTRLPFLGEKGSLNFRTEIFNIANHPNFGMPNGITFTGALSDYGAYSEAPSSSSGAITSTVTTSRQVQFALKVLF